MTKLVMQQAPSPTTPRRFLLLASVWGMLAGGLLLCEGGTLLASRWGAGTLAFVHAMTLGFLGNAMFGSLLQFLPVAAQVPIRGGVKGAWVLLALLNSGTVMLVLALYDASLLSPVVGGVALVAAFGVLSGMLLPGLWAAGSAQAVLRGGIAAAVLASLVTAVLGFLLVLNLAGWRPLPIVPWIDVHASWGLLGWVLALLAAVARVVMPMFQGALVPPARRQGIWQVALCGVLLSALPLAMLGRELPWLRIAVGGLLLTFALGGLVLQWRAPKLRRVPLTGFWMAGLLTLAVAGVVLLATPDQAVLVGVLVLAIGLPLLVTGMQLEIIAFLGWIELQRHCGRGVHLPGVQLLLPPRDKALVLGLHLLAALILIMALYWPKVANSAGAAMLLAHAAGLAALCGVHWRGHRFMSRQKAGR